MDTAPLFAGCLWFLIFLVIGLFNVAFPAQGKARWHGLLYIAVGMVGLLPLLQAYLNDYVFHWYKDD